MAVFYRLAHGAKRTRTGHRWPFEIAICFDGVPEPVMLSEGVGAFGTSGGTFSASEALDPRWSDYFGVTGGAWLRSFLERMAAGERVDAREPIAHYLRLHGHRPKTYEASAP